MTYLSGIHEKLCLVAGVDDDADDEVSVHELGAPEEDGGGRDGGELGVVLALDVPLEVVEVLVRQLVLHLAAEVRYPVWGKKDSFASSTIKFINFVFLPGES